MGPGAAASIIAAAAVVVAINEPWSAFVSASDAPLFPPLGRDPAACGAVIFNDHCE